MIITTSESINGMDLGSAILEKWKFLSFPCPRGGFPWVLGLASLSPNVPVVKVVCLRYTHTHTLTEKRRRGIAS